MIEVCILDWDDAVLVRGEEPGALAAALQRLTTLGVDVMVVTAGPVDGVYRILRPTPGGPGRLLVWSGQPPQVFEIVGPGDGAPARPSPLPGPDVAGGGAGGPAPHSVAWARRWLVDAGSPFAVLVVGPPLEAEAPDGADARAGALARLDQAVSGLCGIPAQGPDPSWNLEVGGFDPSRERDVESWLTVGNGRTGTRGSLEEGNPASLPAVYVAGVYGAPEDNPGGPELVRGPEWTRLAPRVGDEDVSLAEGETVEHRRVLDLRQGLVLRDWRQRLASGRECRFRSVRMASLADRTILALEAELQSDAPATSLAGPIAVLDGPGTVESVEEWSQKDRAVVSLRGRGGRAASFLVTTREHDGKVERVVAVDRDHSGTSRDGGGPLAAAEVDGMDVLRARHRHAWRGRWCDADVVVAGSVHDQRALRFSLYHLIASGDPEGDVASIGARGLTGPGYRGHVFWDTEVFVLPFFIWTHPPTARALLAYRYRTLDAARAKAARLGYSGALFAWESADTGDETTPPFVVMPDGTRLTILTGLQEHHISGDVAWAAWQYWRVTGDEDFLVTMGAEMIVETARFWASRARLGHDGRYHIDEVIGPDEYHEGVDDNAFTNVLARWNLERAVEVCRLVEKLDARAGDGLAGRLRIEAAEPEQWQAVATGLVDLFDPRTLVYEQFAGFRQLEDVRAVDLAPRPFTGEAVLGVSRLRGSQVVKQADVLMLAQMLPDVVGVDVAEANYRYYEPRTCHGSSLSPAIHATVAARVGAMDDAERYFQMAAGIDLDDRMGNAAQGVHIATMGGLWQAAVFGFGGVRPDGDALRIDPVLPASWDRLAFPVCWRGGRVRVDLEGDELTVHLDGPSVLALGNGAPCELAPGSYVARRRKAGWSGLTPADSR
jgi:kojibiose phosphorylase